MVTLFLFLLTFLPAFVIIRGTFRISVVLLSFLLPLLNLLLVLVRVGFISALGTFSLRFFA